MATGRRSRGNFFAMTAAEQLESGEPRRGRRLERVVRAVFEHPYRFPLIALGLAELSIILRHLDQPRLILQAVAAGAVFLLWIPVWGSCRERDPRGQSPVTIVVALIGSLIMGGLLTVDLGFSIVALAMMPQYFIHLPFFVAVLSGCPPSIGSEYSHRIEVLANPDHFPWVLAVVRSVALLAIGISFKLLSIQIEERKRLQSSLASAERKAGVLEERQRLAREIHDTLAQGFASIIVHLERAEQINGLGGSPAKGHMDLARSVAREGLEEARRMMAALRPEILERRALPEAVTRFCEEWSRRTGIPSRLEITGTPSPMHPDIELTLLRGVQESLTNVARHSGARTTAVTLSYMEDIIVLDVQDDGKGFVPGSTGGDGKGGFGLHGMRERVEALQGSLQVESTPGEGTTISLALPVFRPVGGDTVTPVPAEA
jgi:signal transduction histidine kinase